MGKDQDIRLKIEAAGADKAAGDVGKVDAAQKGLTDQTKDAKKPTEELDAATKKLTASEEDYTALLGRVHPALGALADMMVKGSKVAGDLGSQQIDLEKITRKATAAFHENAKTIALLGSAGVAAVGFTALAKSIAYVREESEKLQARLDALEERATSEQAEVIAGEQQVIEQARGRREGAPGAEEAAGMREMYREFRRKDAIPPELLGELEKNIATLYGVATKQMIETITLGGRDGVDPADTRESRERRAGELAEGAEQNAARVREEYRARRAYAWQQAVEEIRDPDITRGREYARAEMERQGLAGDRKLIEKIVRRVIEMRRTWGKGITELPLEKQIEEATRRLEGDYSISGAFASDVFGRSVEHTYGMAGAERFLQAMDARQRPQTVIKTTNINPRFTYPDAETRRRHTVNGQTYRTRMGDG